MTASPQPVCDFTALEQINLVDTMVDPAWAYRVPAAQSRRFRFLILARIEDEVIVATCNPRVERVKDFLRSHLDCPFRLVRVDEYALRRVMSKVFPESTSAVGSLRDRDTDECKHVALCHQILSAATLRGASDIHLVPGEEQLRVRFRVDGVLEDYQRVALSEAPGLISRIKVLAGMDIAEKRQSQDGRFRIDLSNRPLTDIRVASLPTRYGERLTLRLLGSSREVSTLEELGMRHECRSLFGRALASRSGLVLLSGSTGSGKSTTLYAAINHLLDSCSLNVITVEDPIEYEFDGVTQVAVDASKNVTFPSALRSILRHDPDVIMIGEIRDAETAELAITAALTGHLVFSTLHTKTSAGVIPRLIDMGVEPYLIAATLRLAVTQRLVRKLCPDCAVESDVEATEVAALRAPELREQRTFRSSGCLSCAGRGYSGRLALFEMLPCEPNVAELISKRPTEAELLELMRSERYPTLLEDGIAKIVSGDTTVQEVIGAIART